MNVNLTPELEALVREKVASGLYNNQSEVVREGLRLLMERDQHHTASLACWKAALEKGLDDAENGRLKDGKAVFESFRADIEQRMNQAG